MKSYRSATGVIALAAFLAIAGSLQFCTDAAPVARGLIVKKGLDAVDSSQIYQNGRKAEVFVHLEKRPEPTTERPDRPDPTTRPTAPNTPTPRPTPTTTRPANTRTTDRDNTPNTRTSTTSTRSSSSSTGSAHTSSTNGPAPPTTTGTDGADGGTVPTGVSEKVLIGLGTVGGFFVFALGGLAFCRHRKKKNLATALLQQSAQFNNNNPYAKLPEPATSTPKESLPMTPTKPLGTYNVVATYTPALADEIEIGLGDSVTILQEYDDGWCMGVNNSRGGVKGVFPRHCVEMGPYEGSQHGAPGGPHYPPSPSFKATANKRMSSIAPAQGWNDGYNGGYNSPNYPPQPSPQYMGPPQQGGGGGGGGGGGYYNGGY
ncbi:hypothetical protein BG004_006863 [Podila humilis]|nr:hypothetical protein BG004_006863 [Podila humilis]